MGRPTKIDKALKLQWFFDVFAKLVPVIEVGFCDRP